MCAIPYVNGLFEKVKKLLSKVNIKTVAKGIHNVGNSLFANLKDKTPAHLQSNVIYEAKCTCDKTYVGQTRQRLEKRMYNHKYSAKNGSEEHSALCKHMIETGHEPTLEDTKILKIERQRSKLDIYEMIEIKKRPECLNKEADSVYLSNAYYNILGLK